MALTMAVVVDGKIEQRPFTCYTVRRCRASGGIPHSGYKEQVPETKPGEVVVFFFGMMPRIYQGNIPIR